MKPLTGKQQQIYDLIVEHVETKGCPPTRAEISEAIGCKSPNSADLHLRAMAKKGAVELHPGISRGIKIIKQIQA